MKGQTLQEWAGASRIFALVFTDIVDSTTLANELRDEKWIELLKKHFAQARRIMTQLDHHEIKIIGDSFMVLFRSPSDALDFALRVYINTGDVRIKIRVGIHVGSAEVIDDDIFGIMVNYTKRVESTDNLSGIRVSDFAKAEIDNRGRHTHLRFTPKEIEFKGFVNPQWTWEVTDPLWVYRPPQGKGKRT
jgi:class 3 adenylate cyclase